MERTGETTSKIKFAFFPTKIDGKWIWFKKYIQHYKWSEHYLAVPIDGFSYMPPLFTTVVRTDYYRVTGYRKTYKEMI